MNKTVRTTAICLLFLSIAATAAAQTTTYGDLGDPIIYGAVAVRIGVDTNGNRVVDIGIRGNPNFPYVLQSTTNLIQPNWTKVVDLPANQTGTWEVILPFHPYSSEFFRAIQVQPAQPVQPVLVVPVTYTAIPIAVYTTGGGQLPPPVVVQPPPPIITYSTGIGTLPPQQNIPVPPVVVYGNSVGSPQQAPNIPVPPIVVYGNSVGSPQQAPNIPVPPIVTYGNSVGNLPTVPNIPVPPIVVYGNSVGSLQPVPNIPIAPIVSYGNSVGGWWCDDWWGGDYSWGGCWP